VRECHPTVLISPYWRCDDAVLGDRELAIPIRVRTRDRHLWTALSVGLLVGSAVWIALRPSWSSIIVGGGLIVLLVWQRVTMLGARRLTGNAPVQLVVTPELISGPPIWSLRWDRVRSITIGETPAGSLRALFIEAFEPSDIELANSRIFTLNRAFSGRQGAVITILERTIDRPVEQLMIDLERISSRELPVGPQPIAGI